MQSDEILRQVPDGRQTILLVDDEQLVVDAGRQVLERLGYRVFTAFNGGDAIGMVEQHKGGIDLVILDLHMPDINGEAVFDAIKNNDRDIKVLLSSGGSLNGEATRMLNRGCNGFIQKPFSILELSENIKKIIP